jgi:hypothetical protein
MASRITSRHAVCSGTNPSRSLMSAIAPFLVVAAGCSVALQQLLNANLGKTLHSALWSAFVSYFGGTIALAVLLAILREPFFNLAPATCAPLTTWTGGIFGAVFIGTSVFMIWPAWHAGTSDYVRSIVRSRMSDCGPCDGPCVTWVDSPFPSQVRIERLFLRG